MNTFDKLIISISFLSFGITTFIYFRENKSVQEDKNNLAQSVDQDKEEVKKSSKNEKEDIFLIDNSAFPFVLFFVLLEILMIIIAYDGYKNFFKNNYTGSVIDDLWRMTKNNFCPCLLIKVTLGSCLIWFTGEGIIASTIYVIICLIKKKPLKYAFDHRFYFLSWKNFFLFVEYSFVIYFIFACLINVNHLQYVIGSFQYLGKKDEKEKLAIKNKINRSKLIYHTFMHSD